jgi:hypothetical protein
VSVACAAGPVKKEKKEKTYSFFVQNMLAFLVNVKILYVEDKTNFPNYEIGFELKLIYVFLKNGIQYEDDNLKFVINKTGRNFKKGPKHVPRYPPHHLHL